MTQIVQVLKTSNTDLNDQMIQIQLHIDDLENRSRRQNIRLRRITESVPQSELCSTVTNIFNCYLDGTPDTDIIIDRVHRTMGPRSGPSDRLRDVLCLHSFILKEEI